MTDEEYFRSQPPPNSEWPFTARLFIGFVLLLTIALLSRLFGV